MAYHLKRKHSNTAQTIPCKSCVKINFIVCVKFKVISSVAESL